MTTKPLPPPAKTAVRTLHPLPDPPREIGDMQEHSHFEMLGDGASLSLHFYAYPRRADSTTLVAGKGYLCQHRRDLQQRRKSVYPDLLVAFDVDAPAITDNRGYEISQVGKPPALAIEMASGSTGVNDYTWKRDIYAGFGVQEYWRFDYTGGQYHDAPLAGDRLTPDGVYQPIPLHTEPDGVIRAYSEVLGLYLCWVPAEEKARLRFWDPVTERYLPDPEEERADRIIAQEIAAAEREIRRNAEQRAIAAEDQAAAEHEGRIAEREARIAAEDQAAAEHEGRIAERDARIAAEDQAAAERDARTAAEQRATAAEESAAAERDARTAAEQRIRQLEQELRRLQNP